MKNLIIGTAVAAGTFVAAVIITRKNRVKNNIKENARIEADTMAIAAKLAAKHGVDLEEIFPTPVNVEESFDDDEVICEAVETVANESAAVDADKLCQAVDAIMPQILERTVAATIAAMNNVAANVVGADSPTDDEDDADEEAVEATSEPEAADVTPDPEPVQRAEAQIEDGGKNNHPHNGKNSKKKKK